MPGATIGEVLAQRDLYPTELVQLALTSYETKLKYSSSAEALVSQIVKNMSALKIDAGEAKKSIGDIIDMQADVNKHLDDAFATAADDYPPPPKTPAGQVLTPDGLKTPGQVNPGPNTSPTPGPSDPAGTPVPPASQGPITSVTPGPSSTGTP